MWELFTKGHIPYGMETPLLEIVRYVKAGGRLEQPKESSDQIYEIMCSCWLEQHGKRPTFTELIEKLKLIIVI